MIKRNLIAMVYLILGVLCAGFATFYRLLITSDIPVSYTISEGLVVQIMFGISTIFFLFASSSLKSNKGKNIIASLFSLLFVWNISMFTIHTDADYYDSSYAQLQLSSLLNSGIVMFFNYYLIVKSHFERSKLLN